MLMQLLLNPEPGCNDQKQQKNLNTATGNHD
jgi:hypothetical protein